jgi:hypothetical protein
MYMYRGLRISWVYNDVQISFIQSLSMTWPTLIIDRNTICSSESQFNVQQLLMFIFFMKSRFLSLNPGNF